MLSEPEAWSRLLGVLGQGVLAFLQAQVSAGAQAVQVFDSWVGALDPDDYTHAVLPTMRDIFAGLSGLDVPRIHCGVGTGGLLTLMRDAGGGVVGIDWRGRVPGGREGLGFVV